MIPKNTTTTPDPDLSVPLGSSDEAAIEQDGGTNPPQPAKDDALPDEKLDVEPLEGRQGSSHE